MQRNATFISLHSSVRSPSECKRIPQMQIHLRISLVAVKLDYSSHPTKMGTEKHKVCQGQTCIIIAVAIGQKIYRKQFARDQKTYESGA